MKRPKSVRPKPDQSNRNKMIVGKIQTVSFSLRLMIIVLACGTGSFPAAQSSKRIEYGANLTVAIYQFDDNRSKKSDPVTILKQTVSTPQDEIEYISRTYGIEDLKARHVRPVGLAEGESFTDARGMNDKLLTFTIVPRRVSREGVTFDFTARYGEQILLEGKGVSVANYETVMLRGSSGDFGIREFIGPNGMESIPEKRSLLVTVTPTIIAVRGLQNRPADLSRPTDVYGSVVRSNPEDLFIMPSVLTRTPLKFPTGSRLKGSLTLEAVIAPDGRVTNVKVLDSPDAAYNARAIEAFRRYKFSPGLLNGKPTYATYRETMVFGGADTP